jgi:sterol desaturase/sphingolipid hydroxylase (fatty acid hydroxylase superfamily)
VREPWAKRIRVMAPTSVLSMATVLGGAHLLRPFMIANGDEPVSWWKILGQVALVLVVYDFTYYFLHRLMHVKKVMRWVHGVHHKARNPSALESTYLDPIEMFAGVALFYGCACAVGPLHLYAFAIVFFIYSALNILVHSGLELGWFGFRPFDFLAKKHHVHHMVDFGKNYSSLTPLPDLFFGTSG